MRCSIALSTLALISSALASISISQPNSGTQWDFSTSKTIKFSSSGGDPSSISIILIDPSTNFQIKIADNVMTSAGEYTTQPNPSVPSGSGYQIQIIDSAGVLAKSSDFTVKAGANSNGSGSGSSASASSAATSAAPSLVTVTASSSSAATSAAATSAAASTGAAVPLSVNQMTVGAGALLGLAFMFA